MELPLTTELAPALLTARLCGVACTVSAAEYRPARWLDAAADRHLTGCEFCLSMLMRLFYIEHWMRPGSIRERNVFTMAPDRMPLRLVPRHRHPCQGHPA